MKNLDRYNSVFVSIFNVRADQLDGGFAYGKLKKWDSITHLSLVTALEEEFDIMFDSDDILNFGSYENGKIIMSKYDIVI